MAVDRQIVINLGGKFDAALAENSDQIFWLNKDSQPHWPVPFCSGLRVQPGLNSANYQPFTSSGAASFPYQLIYRCALHPAMQGQLIINPASGSGTTQWVVIRGGQFPTVTANQNDQIVWVNSDSVVHWPVPGCFGLRMDPGQTSSAYQPFNATSSGSQAIQYVCALHPQEQGTLTIYPDFNLGTSPFTGKVNSWIQITTGGVGSFDTSKTTWPIGLVVDASPAGIRVTSNAPLNQNINLNVTDRLGVNIQQVISLVITT